MKPKIYLLLAGLFLLSGQLKAQAPNLFNYQGVARNALGNQLTNQKISLRFTIHQASALGATVYSEVDTVTTNEFGLFTVSIGSGTVESGNMATISWGTNSYYLEVEMDPTGGANYTDLGAQQLLSVPYALYAQSSGNSSSSNTKFVAGTGIAINDSLIGAQVDSALWNANKLQGDSVSITAPTVDQVLQWNGAAWAPATQTIYTDTTLTGDGTLASKLGIAQNGATAGQVLEWNGTIWAPTTVSTGGSGWALTGNTGTIPGTNFIGTTDDNGLQFEMNNQNSGRIENYDGGSAGEANTALGYEALSVSAPGQQNTGIGYQALQNNNSGGVGYNVAVGSDAMQDNTSGQWNTGLGTLALQALTSGSFNIGVGPGSLSGNSTGSTNIGIGQNALNNGNGSNNIAIGFHAAAANSITGSYNDGIGIEVLYALTNGSNNDAMGYNALYNLQNASNDVAIGYSTLFNDDYTGSGSGQYNTGIGSSALYGNVDAAYNTGIGYQALYQNDQFDDNTAYNNTALGALALFSNIDATNNVAVGYQALYNNDLDDNNSASYNTAVGTLALSNDVDGSSNTAIGFNANFSSSDQGNPINNSTAIGANALVNTSNTVQLGRFANVQFDQALMPAGNAGNAGQLLQSNGANTAPTWVTSSGAGTVTSVGSGFGLQGGAITTSGTLSIDTSRQAGVGMPTIYFVDSTVSADITAQLTQPNQQLVYGTGSGVTSSANVIYNGSQLYLDLADGWGGLHVEGISGGEASIALNPDNIGNGNAGMWVLATNGSNMNSTADWALYNAGNVNQPIYVTQSTNAITFDRAYTFPTSDGSNGQVLTTDGSGNVTWVRPGSNGGDSAALGYQEIGYGDANNIMTGNSNLIFDAFSNVQLHNGNFALDDSHAIMFNSVNDANWMILRTTGNGKFVTGNALTLQHATGPGEGMIIQNNYGSVEFEILGSTGAITFNKAYTFPTSDGSTGQVLTTDGSGDVSWATAASGTVTSIGSGFGLQGGAITTSGTLSIDTSRQAGVGIPTIYFVDSTISANVSSQLAQPNEQLVYGTGSGVTSNSNLTYDGTNLQLQNGGLILGGDQRLYLSNGDPNWVMFKNNITGKYAADAMIIQHGTGTGDAFVVRDDAGNEDLEISESGSASLITFNNAYTFPTTDGTSGQVFSTDGAGNITWTTPATPTPAWDLTGNIGTTYGTNFIGTIDDQGLQFEIDNSESGRIEDITTGKGSTAFGYQSMETESSSSIYGTGFGFRALNIDSGTANLGVGSYALRTVSGSYNTAIGAGSQSSRVKADVTGNNNTGLGSYTLWSLYDGNNNTAAGYLSEKRVTSGSHNAAFGVNALGNSNGSFNTAVGDSSLVSDKTGNHNTAIGYDADVTVNGLTNSTVIGYGATVATSNTMVLGNNNVIALDINGALSPWTSSGYNSGTVGQILQSNGTGVAPTWVAPANATAVAWALTGNSGTTYGTNYIGTSDNTNLMFEIDKYEAGRIENATTANTALGYGSLYDLGSGTQNTGVGVYALYPDVDGSDNTALGYEAGFNASDNGNPSSNITLIGANSFINNIPGAINNATVIGASAEGDSSNSLVLGNHLVAQTDFNGAFGVWTGSNYNDGVAGQVLQSNGLDVAPTWVTPSVSALAWALTGNAGTTYGTNYIGTSDETNIMFGLGGAEAGRLEDNTTANTSLGYQTLMNETSGELNTAMGNSALEGVTSGSNNSSFGTNSMFNIQTSSYNSAVGAWAMSGLTSGSNNVGVGYNAMANLNGSQNTALGSSTMSKYPTSSGNQNTAIGDSALYDTQNGSALTALGYNATVGASNLNDATAIGSNAVVDSSFSVVLGDNNVTQTDFNGALGVWTGSNYNEGASGQVLQSNGYDVAPTWVTLSANAWNLNGNSGTTYGTNYIGTADDEGLMFQIDGGIAGRIEDGNPGAGSNWNNAIGYQAMVLDSGQNNNALGGFALNYNSGSNNVAVGNVALGTNSGDYNTAIGADAMNNNQGSQNTAVGFGSLNTNLTGSQITVLGSNANVSVDGLNNATAIGAGAVADSSNSVVFGNNSVTQTDFNGALGAWTGSNYNEGAAGQILQSNGPDVAPTWVTPGAGGGWALTGNSGTTYGTDFIGTTDDEGIQFRVDNTISGIIEDGTFSNSSDDANTSLGYQALVKTSNGYNTAVGYQALDSNTTGFQNTAEGTWALRYSRVAVENTAVGYSTLSNVDFDHSGTANWNTAVGADVATGLMDGNSNVIIGYDANIVDNNVNSSNGNTAIGADAQINTQGGGVSINNATALGYMAEADSSNSVVLGNNQVTQTDFNGALGVWNGSNYNEGAAGQVLQSNGPDVAPTWATPTASVSITNAQIGYGSGSNTLTSDQYFIRIYQGIQVSDGADNIFIGGNDQAGNAYPENQGGGSENISLGSDALGNISNGNNNIALGDNALATNSNGSNLIAIGSGADVNADGYTNSIALGSTTITSSNQFVMNSSITNWNIGGVSYAIPTSQGSSNTVLTNDGSGNLSWAAPSSPTGVAEYLENTLLPNVSVPAGNAFTIGNQVVNTIPGEITTTVANSGTVFLLTTGTYSIDYEMSLTAAGSIALYTGPIPAVMAIDNNTVAGSSTATTWIHGHAFETVTGILYVMVSPATGTATIATTGNDAGQYIVRLTITKVL